MQTAQWIARIRLLFATPARQAYGFAAVGVLGLLFGGAGILLATTGGNEDTSALPAAVDTVEATVTSSPTRTATPARTATPSPTPSPTQTPSPTEVIATRAPIVAQPTATPVPVEPTATAPAVIAGGPYCPSVSATAPPTTVGGTITLGGIAPPAGTIVALAFDGVPGPSSVVSVESTATGPRAGYAIRFSGGPGDCANRVGAAISVVIDGTYYATGRFVGDGDPFIRLDITG